MNAEQGVHVPATEIEVAQAIRWAAEPDATVIRKLAFERDFLRHAKGEQVRHLESRIERMSEVLGKVRMSCEIPPELYREIDEVMLRETR